jgi:hypothetical protein
VSPEKQLQAIVEGKVSEAVRSYLDGDWSRVATLFTIPRSAFDSWADNIELPYAGVSKRRGTGDGVYVLEDAEGWLVFTQANGVQLPGARTYANYRQAKRAALADALLNMLRGAV